MAKVEFLDSWEDDKAVSVMSVMKDNVFVGTIDCNTLRVPELGESEGVPDLTPEDLRAIADKIDELKHRSTELGKPATLQDMEALADVFAKEDTEDGLNTKKLK